MHELSVSVAEILGRPGAYRDIHISKPLPGVRTALARLQKDLDAELRLESVVEGVLVTGRATGPAVLQCARCLKQLPTRVSADVCELFYAPGHEPPPDEDAYVVGGLEMDLEPMLRDALTLALPLNPLCDEDCKGLCARCGKDLNLNDCTCTEPESDPRWAALDALRDKLAQ
ncbi:MAG: DUF177 domain-containing protein [Actinomycetota bacterium]|nr:DUF177 domain-containing protein [Actinomycetota bacterium]